MDIAEDHHTLWLRMGTGKEPVEIPLNTRIFSLSIEFKSHATIAFYRRASEATADEPPAPLAITALKNTSSLIIFSPAADQKKYEIFTIADGDSPFGSFRLVKVGGFVALGLIVLSFFLPITLGFWFSAAMVVFASGCILYNTSNLIHRYEPGQHVAASLSLFASVALLFWYVLQLLMRLKRD